MKPWHDADVSRYMAEKTQPTASTYEAQVAYKSKVRATLCGRDADELKARAHRYATAMNWHRAVVTVSEV